MVVPTKGSKGLFTINRASPQARGLVHWLPLNDGAGLRCRDYIKNTFYPFNGTPDWQTDPDTGSYRLHFDGLGEERVDIDGTTKSPYITSSVKWTVSVWGMLDILPPSSGESYTIFANSQGSSDRATLTMNRYEAFSFCFYNGTSTYGICADEDNVVVGQEYHCVVTCDGGGDSSAVTTMYINGVKQPTSSLTNAISYEDGFYLGEYGAGGGSVSPHSGTIRDFRVYNRELSEGEVANLFQARWDLYAQPSYRKSNYFIQSDTAFGGGPLVGPGGLVA